MQLWSNVIIYLIYWVYLDDMNYEYESITWLLQAA